ncbi:hypothetical protein P5673_009413 [Acropora cervicornis]|uniref:Uncharacterized protein n=1 Tax=Acropora cervicornis TaxID=6130 RepID=A0AAD9QTD7_ACRCE|nr:hypothetical protein P5673_009413 [Acropora cervicornis]
MFLLLLFFKCFSDVFKAFENNIEPFVENRQKFHKRSLNIKTKKIDIMTDQKPSAVTEIDISVCLRLSNSVLREDQCNNPHQWLASVRVTFFWFRLEFCYGQEKQLVFVQVFLKLNKFLWEAVEKHSTTVS